MRYLVIRLSALGDVAMTIPVLYAVAKNHPRDNFTLLTQPFPSTMLLQAPENVEAMAIDTGRDEKTFPGLHRFARRLAAEKFDMVIDLHNVLRSRYLRMHLRLCGTPSRHLCKPRRLHKLLTARPPLKRLKPLEPMIRAYAAVFHRAGLTTGDSLETYTPPVCLSGTSDLQSPAIPRVGIAPFAAHTGKMYPLEQMEKVVRCLSESEGVEVILFGGRTEECRILENWAAAYPRVSSVAGTLQLPDELSVMKSLHCMVSMDSANMHLASLVGTRVISIWCATHPHAGFLGYGQSEDDVVSRNLPCRPCSVFGNKPCYRKDYACRSITPAEIVKKVMNVIFEAKSKQ